MLAAWWSEATGHLTATIQVRNGIFVAEHDDAQVNGSGFALVFNGSSYLRARAPAQDHAGDPVVYDYGTYANGVVHQRRDDHRRRSRRAPTAR